MEKIKNWQDNSSPQKSDEWYEQRKKTFGASEIANFCMASEENIEEYNKICSSEMEVDEKKPMLDYPKTRDRFFFERLIEPVSFSKEEDSPVVFGNRYEPIAQRFFEKVKQQKIYEVGSIVNPRIDFLAASPDGIIINNKPSSTITTSGANGISVCLSDDIRGIELKCPISRTVRAYPGKTYYNQIQSQGYVLGAKYIYFQDMDIRKITPMDYTYAKDNDYPFKYYGATFKDDINDCWIYPPDEIDTYEKLDAWISLTSSSTLDARVTYHKIHKVYITKIPISRHWEKRNYPEFQLAKELETYYKSVPGRHELIDKIQKRTRIATSSKKKTVDIPMF